MGVLANWPGWQADRVTPTAQAASPTPPAAALGGAAAPVGAAGSPATQPAPEPEPPKPVLRIYKVWDLIDVPAAPAPENSAIPPTRLYEPTARTVSIDPTDTSAAPPAHARPSVGSLAAILRDAIHFDDEVSIQSIEGMFLVTALPESHRKIEQFLGAVRKELASRRVVTIQATWVAVDDDKAAKLLALAAVPPKALTPEALKALEEDVAYQGSALGMEGQRICASPPGSARRSSPTPRRLRQCRGDETDAPDRPVGSGPEVKADLSEDGAAAVELDSILSEPGEIVPKPLRRAAGAALAASRPVF